MMHDDMRLKSMVAKGLGSFNVPCLEVCSGSCPCEKMKDFVKKETEKPSANVTSLEFEWVYVPTWKSAAVWSKLAFPIGVVLTLGGLLCAGVLKGCCSNKSEIKVSLSGSGYQIEHCSEPIEAFEKNGTNEIRCVVNALKCLREPGNN